MQPIEDEETTVVQKQVYELAMAYTFSVPKATEITPTLAG